MKRKIKELILYMIIGMVFYLLDCENLFINDDLNYAMNQATGEPIRNLWDAIQSQCYDWFYQNGRFVVHTLVQCFCGFIGTEIFWVLNTVVFLLWLKGLEIYTKQTLSAEVSPAGILLLGAVLTVPEWGITNLGYISGAVNYLWCGCAYLWFIIWYQRNKEANDAASLANGIWVGVISALVGSLQESFCIGIAGYFVLFYARYFSKFKGVAAWMVGGFCIGAALCVLAPANFYRLAETETKTTGWLRYVEGFALVLTNSTTYILMILTFLALWLSREYKNIASDTLNTHALIIVTASINAIFAAVVAYTGARQLSGIELFSLLVLVSIIYQLWILRSPKIERTLTRCSYIIVLLMCIPIWQQRKSISKAYDVFMNNAMHSKNGIAVATDYMHEITLERGWIRTNFVRSQENLNNTLWLSRYLSEGKNDSMIACILPEPPELIIQECSEANKVGEGIYKPQTHNFYILRCCLEDNNRVVQISRKVSLFGEIRNRIQTGNPLNVDYVPLTTMHHFSSGNLTYYIQLDDRNRPIENIKTEEVMGQMPRHI